ncbi:DUF6131 family protein [Mycobacterium xenopi]|uniref:DUF6131 family protein n=1 Tax=Mycobacterium xenopi TaxID=1789 RepID=UPI003F69573E
MFGVLLGGYRCWDKIRLEAAEVGIILLVIGAVFWILGAIGRPVAGRRYWY